MSISCRRAIQNKRGDYVSICVHATIWWFRINTFNSSYGRWCSEHKHRYNTKQNICFLCLKKTNFCFTSTQTERKRLKHSTPPLKQKSDFSLFCLVLGQAWNPFRDVVSSCGRNRWPSSWCGSVWTSGIYTSASSPGSLESVETNR